MRPSRRRGEGGEEEEGKGRKEVEEIKNKQEEKAREAATRLAAETVQPGARSRPCAVIVSRRRASRQSRCET